MKKINYGNEININVIQKYRPKTIYALKKQLKQQVKTYFSNGYVEVCIQSIEYKQINTTDARESMIDHMEYVNYIQDLMKKHKGYISYNIDEFYDDYYGTEKRLTGKRKANKIEQEIIDICKLRGKRKEFTKQRVKQLPKVQAKRDKNRLFSVYKSRRRNKK